MISFELGRGRFNYRVVAVCVEDGHVLLHRAEIDSFWSLPGGRAELLESSEVSLKREMLEELGVEVTIDRLLWVVENFFVWHNTDWHELALYYHVELPVASAYGAKTATYRGVEAGEVLLFQWFPLTKLGEIRLFPTFLKEALLDLPHRPAHVVHTDVDEKD